MASTPSTQPHLLQRQPTLTAYTDILDDFQDGGGRGGPKRQWSIRQANSRLQSHGLEAALESDLSLQLQEEKERGIPMTVLSSPVDSPTTSSSRRRQSNNPYLSSTLLSPPTTPPANRTQAKHKMYGFEDPDPFSVAPMEAWQEMKDYNLRTNGLPTLDQMMRISTRAPLTQANFAAFLRCRGVQQNLNFLLELETHDKLWRAYVNSIRRQTRMDSMPGSERVSRFLESVAEKPANTKDTMMMMYSNAGGGDYDYRETPDTEDLLNGGGTPRSNYFPSDIHGTNHNSNNNNTYASRTPQGKDGQSLTRHDLCQNATRIYRTFCSQFDAAQPILLPDDHRAALEELVEKHRRPEPIVFESAKSHVFEILNVFYYPQFVDSVLYTNISVATARILLALGILLLTFAFALELSLVFLDHGTMRTRWWAMLPFLFGWSALLSGFSHFAFWLAFIGKR